MHLWIFKKVLLGLKMFLKDHLQASNCNSEYKPYIWLVGWLVGHADRERPCQLELRWTPIWRLLPGEAKGLIGFTGYM